MKKDQPLRFPCTNPHCGELALTHQQYCVACDTARDAAIKELRMQWMPKEKENNV